MSHKLIIGGIGIGLFVVALGVFVTPMIDATESDSQTAVTLADGQYEYATDLMRVEANVTQNNNATFEIRNERTQERNSTSEMTRGDREHVNVGGETVTVTYVYHDGTNAVAELQYPPTFGYSDSGKTFFDNLGIILALTGFMIAIGGVLLGLRS